MLHGRRIAEADVQARVVAAEVAGGGVSSRTWRRPGVCTRTGAQPEAIALRAFRANLSQLPPLDLSSGGLRPWLAIATSSSPSLSMSATASPRPTRFCRSAGPLIADVAEPAADVLVEQRRLLEAQRRPIELHVVDHVAVGDQEVEIAVVVVVEELGPEPERQEARPSRRSPRRPGTGRRPGSCRGC